MLPERCAQAGAPKLAASKGAKPREGYAEGFLAEVDARRNAAVEVLTNIREAEATAQEAEATKRALLERYGTGLQSDVHWFPLCCGEPSTRLPASGGRSSATAPCAPSEASTHP